MCTVRSGDGRCLQVILENFNNYNENSFDEQNNAALGSSGLISLLQVPQITLFYIFIYVYILFRFYFYWWID